MKITEINGVVVDDVPLRTARVIEPCRKHRVPGNREREGEKKKKKLVIDRFEFSDLDLFLEEGTEGECE